MPKLGQPLLDILTPQAHEHILDLGCGDGTLTQELVPLCKHVTAIDSSANMIAHARSLGLNAHVVDANKLNFDAEFDAVFSNAALHWMLQPADVLKGCHNALKPNGRMVAEMGGAGNVEHIHTELNHQRALLGLPAIMPWFFPTPDEYSALAQQAGFTVKSITLFPRPTPLPTGLRQWLATFAHLFVSDLTSAQQDALLDTVCSNLKGKLTDENGDWFADYVRLRFELVKHA